MNRIIFLIISTIARCKNIINRRTTTAGKIVLFLTVVSFFFGLNYERNMLFQLFPILFLLLLIGFLFSLRLQIRLSCSRALPATAVAESRLSYQLHLQNKTSQVIDGIFFREWHQENLPTYQETLKRYLLHSGKRKSFLSRAGIEFLVADFFPQPLFDQDDFELPKLVENETLDHRVFLTPHSRGNHHFDGFMLYRKDPLGLFIAPTIQQSQANLLVLPKLYPAAKLQFSKGRKYSQGGMTASKDHGDSEEFISLREYAQGDPLKHIDWKSSAKTGNIIVKQFKSEYFSRYGMVLDTFCSPQHKDLFEASVSAAASLFMAQDLGESVLDLLFVGDRCYQETAASGANEQVHFLKILASVQGCDAKRFNDLYALVKDHLDQLSGAVLILCDVDKNRKKLAELFELHQIPHTVILLCNSKKEATKDLAALQWNTPVVLVDKLHIGEQLTAI